GPYGLSLAAYLRRAGVAHRIFGSAMASWRTQMPTTMFLKSEGFASNLAQPDREMTLRDFCEESGYAYRDYGLPIPLHVFIKYGLAFQRHFAPDLEDTVVSEIRRHDRGFALLLGTGEQVLARNVVIATGIDPYRYMPTALAGLPSQLRSHTADHSDYSTFRGRRVCVIGTGASATDTAAALRGVVQARRAGSRPLRPGPHLFRRAAAFPIPAGKSPPAHRCDVPRPARRLAGS
ncbi:MAG: NAD(P)-binding domain-containing protein, partial [Rhodospirillales bacterium]|nr:NAD(P)-binding domain-containing protein [Rhodospirillales bacterium]